MPHDGSIWGRPTDSIWGGAAHRRPAADPPAGPPDPLNVPDQGP